MTVIKAMAKNMLSSNDGKINFKNPEYLGDKDHITVIDRALPNPFFPRFSRMGSILTVLRKSCLLARHIG